jgi:hypothetical protein
VIAFARGARIGLRKVRSPPAVHCVECGGECRVAIAEQKLDAVGVAVEVHQQVPGHRLAHAVLAENVVRAGCEHVLTDDATVGRR